MAGKFSHFFDSAAQHVCICLHLIVPIICAHAFIIHPEDLGLKAMHRDHGRKEFSLLCAHKEGLNV